MRRMLKNLTPMILATAITLVSGEDMHAADGLRYKNHNAINLTVTIDFAEIVRLPQSIATVIIGNSGVVDVELPRAGMMVLTGKAPGVTNLVLVNEDGDQTDEYLVEVVPSRRKLTTVHQGSKKETYQCGNGCTPVLSVGDDGDHFDKAGTQTQTRNTFSETQDKANSMPATGDLPY